MPRRKIVCTECSETFTPTRKYPGPLCRLCTEMKAELKQERQFLGMDKLMERGLSVEEAWKKEVRHG